MTTPLEQALIAWSKVKDPNNRQPQVDDAVSLGETGMFSNIQIALITGLQVNFVNELLTKPDKTGGRFTPEALPFLHDIAQAWAYDYTVDKDAVRFVVGLGVSPGMVSRLTGISTRAIYYWIQKGTK
jgi:hypothetical protein